MEVVSLVISMTHMVIVVTLCTVFFFTQSQYFNFVVY